jgi:hypothetical protein
MKVTVRSKISKLAKTRYQCNTRNYKAAVIMHIESPTKTTRIPDKPKVDEVFAHNRKVCRNMF